MRAGVANGIRLKNPTLVVLTLALGGMALAFASSLFFYVFYVCLILVLASYLWVRALAGRVALAREMRSDWVQVGDQLRERFTLTNESRVGALWVEIQDHSNVPGTRPAGWKPWGAASTASGGRRPSAGGVGSTPLAR